ncbi:MAG: ABC transporter permease [Candidatus Thiodiazotropha endolucinida]
MMFSQTNRFIRGYKWKGLGVSFSIFLLFICATLGLLFSPEFLSIKNIEIILFTTATYLPVTLGTQALLILGRFDLSLGAQASLYGIIAGTSYAYTDSVAVAVIMPLVSATLLGMVCGTLIAKFRLDQLVITLAIMGIARSLALLFSDGRVVTTIPSGFDWVQKSVLSNIPDLVLIGLLTVIILDISFKNLTVFRRLYAVGGNSIAADKSGISADFIVITTYIAAAIGAVAVGLIQTGRTLSASPLIFSDLAIYAIAACLVGGGTIHGGRGSMVGGALGLLAIVSTENLILISEVPVYWRQLVIGLLLIIALTLQVKPDFITNTLKVVLFRQDRRD